MPMASPTEVMASQSAIARAMRSAKTWRETTFSPRRSKFVMLKWMARSPAAEAPI
jgi:hypothetical protein